MFLKSKNNTIFKDTFLQNKEIMATLYTAQIGHFFMKKFPCIAQYLQKIICIGKKNLVNSIITKEIYKL